MNTERGYEKKPPKLEHRRPEVYDNIVLDCPEFPADYDGPSCNDVTVHLVCEHEFKDTVSVMNTFVSEFTRIAMWTK